MTSFKENLHNEALEIYQSLRNSSETYWELEAKIHDLISDLLWRDEDRTYVSALRGTLLRMFKNEVYSMKIKEQ